MKVLGSNDAATWDEVTTLTNLSQDADVKMYDSPCVRLWKKYRYVRFSVLETGGNLIIGGGPAFSVTEFQMFPVKAGETSSYATNASVKEKADALYEALIAAHALIAANSAKQADVDDIKSKVDALKAAL